MFMFYFFSHFYYNLKLFKEIIKPCVYLPHISVHRTTTKRIIHKRLNGKLINFITKQNGKESARALLITFFPSFLYLKIEN